MIQLRRRAKKKARPSRTRVSCGGYVLCCMFFLLLGLLSISTTFTFSQIYFPSGAAEVIVVDAEGRPI